MDLGDVGQKSHSLDAKPGGDTLNLSFILILASSSDLRPSIHIQPLTLDPDPDPLVLILLSL